MGYFRGERELAATPEFHAHYDLVAFEAREPRLVRQLIWVRRDSPRIGIARSEREVRIPAYLFALNPQTSVTLDGAGHAGVEVTREVRTPILAYTGDTSPSGLDNNPTLYDTKILITEISFIRPNHRREKIHKFGHMHLDDFIERADRFKNELIICGHFSTRYHPQEVRKLVEAKLPPGLRERVKLWI